MLPLLQPRFDEAEIFDLQHQFSRTFLNS